MANRVALLTPLVIWTALLAAAQWPASVTATKPVCGPDANQQPYCLPSDPIRNDLWQVNIDCSLPDTISVDIKDTYSETTLIDGVSIVDQQQYRQVRIHCTDGNIQAEMSVNCSIPSVSEYTISNISALGIEPGWTCSFHGCVQLDLTSGNTLYYHTATDSCTFELPIDPTTTDEPTTTPIETSTEVDVTMTTGTTTSTEVGVTVPIRVGDSTTTVHGTDVAESPVLGLNNPDPIRIVSVLLPVIGMLVLLITVVSLMILFVSRMKQQRAKKTALLILDRKNMIFDPDYTPGICIDNQSYYNHRTSMISNMDYLQFLTVMEKPGQFPTDVQVLNFDENSYPGDSSFGHDLNLSNSKQHSNTMVGAAKDTVICPEEFPGSNTSGYVFSGDSSGFSSPQQMDTTEHEFQSPSDSASELTLSYGGCLSSGYIGDPQLDNSTLMYDNVSVTYQDTLSGNTLNFFAAEDDPVEEAAGVIGLDRCSYPSSSSSGYVEQMNTSNQPLMTRDDDNVFEPAHKQGDGYVQSQHPIAIASSNRIFSDTHQTEGYVVDLQNTHTNHQDTEVACPDRNNMDCFVSKSISDATRVAVASRDQSFPLDIPHLTNTDRGYVLNEHPTATALIVTEDRKSQELNIVLDCENTFEEGELEEPSHDLYSSSMEDGVSGRSLLDVPSSPDKTSSQGYVTTEDIDMTKFISREIVVPSNQVSSSQIEPGFTVHLDFDNGNDSCHDQEKDEVGYVRNSGCPGIKTDHNRDMNRHHSQSSNQTATDSNGYVTNQPTSVPGIDKREQYVSYDFHSMASELRDSHSTSVTPEPAHSPNLGPVRIHYQVKSNYYPASDMSSGYLSGSSVSGDTSVYLGMDKFEQLDLYSYK